MEEITICDTQKKDILLSWRCCQQLNIIPHDFPKPIQVQSIEEEKAQKLKMELMQEFSDVFEYEQMLKTMTGSPMKIHLKENVEPFRINAARPIPHAYRDKVKEKLEEMV